MSPSSTYAIERYGFAMQAYKAVCYAVLAAARQDKAVNVLKLLDRYGLTRVIVHEGPRAPPAHRNRQSGRPEMVFRKSLAGIRQTTPEAIEATVHGCPSRGVRP